MQNSGGSWSLIFSLLSLVVAACSLAWNVYTNRRQEAAPNIELSWSLTPPASARKSRQEDQKTSQGQQYDPYIIVRVANAGRGNIGVSKITFHADRGRQATGMGKRPEPPLPETVEGGSTREWQYRLDTVLSTLQLDRKDAERIFAMVQLGNGRSIRTANLNMGGLFELLGSVIWHQQGAPETKPAADPLDT